jgi:cholesterol 7alpha-monooxygenase
MYVVDSPEDVSAVYKAPKTLDFDPFVKDILGKYGVTHDTLAKLFARPQEDVKSWMDASLESMKMQLHPGEKLDTLQKDLLGYVDEALTWDKLQGRMVVHEESEEKLVSLYDWAAMVIADGQTRALFDPVIYKLCPDIVHQIQIYEEEGWKLPLDLPSFATKAMRASQAYIEAGLIHYMELPDDERPGESWLFRKLCTETRELDIDKAQAAKVLFPLYRVYASCISPWIGRANRSSVSMQTLTDIHFGPSPISCLMRSCKMTFERRSNPRSHLVARQT